MDHSLRGYLERQTTQCLQALLDSIQKQDKCPMNDEVVEIIQDILRKRDI